MSIFESVRVALGALGANKLRTVLTMLGMIIGVCAVISLMSIGQGAQAQATSQIRGMGTNLIFIRPGSTQSSGVRSAQWSAVSLTADDANTSSRVTGTTPDYPDVRNFKPANGEFFGLQQMESRSTVVVLGANVA